MNGLDERITRAGADVHRLTRDLPARPAGELHRRLRRRRRLAGAAVVVVGVALIGGTALLFTGDTLQSPAGVAPPAPAAATGSSPAPVGVDDLPVLGIDREGWSLVNADQTGCDTLPSRTVEYRGSELFALLQIVGVPAGSDCEQQLWWMSETNYETVQVRGHDARLLPDSPGFVVAWRESDEAVVTLVVQPAGSGATLTRGTALSVAESVTELDPTVWEEVVDGYRSGRTPTTRVPSDS